MNYAPIIVVLVLILVIILLIFAGVKYAQYKIRQFSRTVFGTNTLAEGAENMRQEYATTPKSVSAMTSLLLPKIVQDFPDFEYDEMKHRANNVLTSYLRAVTEGNVGILQEDTTELRQQLENHIELNKGKGIREQMQQVRIHRTEIYQYRKAEGRCIITFQSAVEYYHYKLDENNCIVEGSENNKYQTKYNTDLIYIQDRSLVENELDHALGVNCPNCGAPLSALGAKVCEYCGTPVVELNIHAWSFSHIEEVR